MMLPSMFPSSPSTNCIPLCSPLYGQQRVCYKLRRQVVQGETPTLAVLALVRIGKTWHICPIFINVPSELQVDKGQISTTEENIYMCDRHERMRDICSDHLSFETPNQSRKDLESSFSVTMLQLFSPGNRRRPWMRPDHRPVRPKNRPSLGAVPSQTTHSSGPWRRPGGDLRPADAGLQSSSPVSKQSALPFASQRPQVTLPIVETCIPPSG